MKELHATQKKLLDLLRLHMDAPLTIRELQDALDVSSPSVVHHHIKQLEKNGFLKRNPSNSKDYMLSDTPEKAIVYLNQYGLAQCGPDGSILEGTPVDRIPIASRLLKFPSGEAFLVEAKGNSMEPKIKSGDLVIARMQKHAENGDIVVCVNNSETLIKKYVRENQTIILHSLNASYHPFLAADDFRIEGVVKNVLQYD